MTTTFRNSKKKSASLRNLSFFSKNNNKNRTFSVYNSDVKLEVDQNYLNDKRQSWYRTFNYESQNPLNLDRSDSEDEEEDLQANNDDHFVSSQNAEMALSQLGSLKDSHIVLEINITELRLIKCFRINILESVWSTKLKIINSLVQKPKLWFNYGLYDSKSGEFLVDSEKIGDYVQSGCVASFQFRYKRRVFHTIIKSRKDSTNLVKMQNVSRQRELLNSVKRADLHKITSLLEKGVDPNFHIDGEIPLTVVSAFQQFHRTNSESTTLKKRNGFLRSSTSSLRRINRLKSNNVVNDQQGTATNIISVLVKVGGAHIDFRNADGLSAIHVAAKTGNYSALKCLLELGAYIDTEDLAGLTPLYVCCTSTSVTDYQCLQLLLSHDANLQTIDSQNWTVLHQVCRHGQLDQLCVLLKHIKLQILKTGEDDKLINQQNSAGNTPLHICSIYNKRFCLLALLDHGADVKKLNFSNQDAVQVAKMCGNTELVEIIEKYPDIESQETGFSTVGRSFKDANDNNNNNRMIPLPKDLNSKVYNFKSVSLDKSKAGFGFVIRGTKASGSELKSKMDFAPQNPGLQYLESVTVNGRAYMAGLRSGDFIIEINGTDVRFMGHSEIVEFIRNSGDSINMKVAVCYEDTPKHASPSKSSMKNRSTNSLRNVEKSNLKDFGIPPPPSPIKSNQTNIKLENKMHLRTPSVTSAIFKLDDAINESVEADSDAEKKYMYKYNSPTSSNDFEKELFSKTLKPNSFKKELSMIRTSTMCSATLPRKPLKNSTLSFDESTFKEPTNRDSRLSLKLSSMQINPNNNLKIQSSESISNENVNILQPTSFQNELLSAIKKGPKNKGLPPLPPERSDSKTNLRTSAQSSCENSERNTNSIVDAYNGKESSLLKNSIVANPDKNSDYVADINDRISSIESKTQWKKNKTTANKNEDLVKQNFVKKPHRPENNPVPNFKLPPPPTISNELFKHPRFNKQNDDLPPPPPAEVLSTFPGSSLPPLPPPVVTTATVVKPLTLFQQKKATSSSHKIETASTADSGISCNQNKPNATSQVCMETNSVISTVSNLSSDSDFNSDFGMSYELRDATTTYIKKKFTDPGGNPGTKPLVMWSVEEVGLWLKSLNLAVYVESFKENEIAGSHLQLLGREELVQLGVKPIGHQLTIKNSVKCFNDQFKK